MAYLGGVKMLEKSEIKSLIDSDFSSRKKRRARKAQNYYDAKHDILKYRIYYFDGEGQLVENITNSNIKIVHPFFTELTDQQTQYMLSGEGNHIRSDIPELQKELDSYFDDDFWAELYDLIAGTATKGFDYMYQYMNENGRSSFMYANSLGVVEVSENQSSDHQKYVIYKYLDYINKNNKKIYKIQVWDNRNTYFYMQIDDGAIVDDTTISINPRPHTVFFEKKGPKDDDIERYGQSYGFIPFYRLDNNRKQIGNLNPIKGLIDDYDLMACSLSNNLQDFQDALYVVSGFEGDDLTDLITNIKSKKHIGVPEGGGVDIKTIDIPYQARQVKLDLDEKNIYRFGMGFNSAQIGDGNITNIVIKSRYALLDLKCNKLEIKLKQFLKKIINSVIDEVNNQNKTAYKLSDVYFDFKREVITNAQDNAQIELIDAQKKQTEINTILSLAHMIDDETIIQKICDILDINYEDIKDKLPETDLYQETDKAIQVLEKV